MLKLLRGRDPGSDSTLGYQHTTSRFENALEGRALLLLGQAYARNILRCQQRGR